MATVADRDLLALLMEIARDVAIDPATESVRDFGQPVPFVRPPDVAAHPSYTAFLTALEEDPELGDLFPDDDEERGRIRAHRPSSLPATLINAALWDSVMDGDGSAAAIESSLRAKLAGLHRRRGRTRATLLCVVKDQRRGAGRPVMGHVGHALIRPMRSGGGGGEGTAGRSEDDSCWECQGNLGPVPSP